VVRQDRLGDNGCPAQSHLHPVAELDGWGPRPRSPFLASPSAHLAQSVWKIPAGSVDFGGAGIYAWFGEHEADIADGGAELLGVETATTVRSGGSVVDGPFSEAKEVIGGFTIVDVADMDAAVALARSWPALELPGNSVEIRPMVVDYSQFE
jgi:hypothetical protein